MSRFKCNKKDNCLRCAGCCHFREGKILSDNEDYVLRKQMWDNKGILYIFQFSRYTISLSDKEKAVMEKGAKELGKEIRMLPKKIMLDENLNPVVLDWSVDADVCPLLDTDNNNSCLIYDERPAVCKAFPNDFMPSVGVKIVRHKDLSFEKALDIAKKKFKL